MRARLSCGRTLSFAFFRPIFFIPYFWFLHYFANERKKRISNIFFSSHKKYCRHECFSTQINPTKHNNWSFAKHTREIYHFIDIKQNILLSWNFPFVFQKRPKPFYGSSLIGDTNLSNFEAKQLFLASISLTSGFSMNHGVKKGNRNERCIKMW